MVQLVKYFNENYGQQYDNIDYPRTSKEMYQVYQVIKSYGIKDDKLLELLNAIVLPKPKTNKEKEMFSECLYEVSDNGSLLNDLIYKETSFLKLTKDDFEVIQISQIEPVEPMAEVPAKEMPSSMLSYVYPHKIDWLNTLGDTQCLGYKFLIKLNENDEIIEKLYNELISSIDCDYFNQDGSSSIIDFDNLNSPVNTFLMVHGSVVLHNGIKPNYNDMSFSEEDCFVICIPNDESIVDFELELFKIDTIPTLPSYDDLGYYLVMGKDGKLYKYLENR